MRILTRFMFLLLTLTAFSGFAVQARATDSDLQVNLSQAMNAEQPMVLAVSAPHPDLDKFKCTAPFPRSKAKEARAAHDKCVAWCKVHVGKGVPRENCMNRDCGSCGAVKG